MLILSNLYVFANKFDSFSSKSNYSSFIWVDRVATLFFFELWNFISWSNKSGD